MTALTSRIRRPHSFLTSSGQLRSAQTASTASASLSFPALRSATSFSLADTQASSSARATVGSSVETSKLADSATTHRRRPRRSPRAPHSCIALQGPRGDGSVALALEALRAVGIDIADNLHRETAFATSTAGEVAAPAGVGGDGARVTAGGTPRGRDAGVVVTVAGAVGLGVGASAGIAAAAGRKGGAAASTEDAATAAEA